MTGFSFTFDDDGTPSIQITGTGKAFAANYGGLLIASALTAAVSIRETAYQTLTPWMERTRGPLAGSSISIRASSTMLH
jgi:hypothetical protein